MLVMFTGPHGTGKSTTAIELSRRLPGYTYIESVAGPVAKEIGFDINKPFTPEDLIVYQEKVFTAFEELYKAHQGQNVIFDRSPLDFATYLSMGLLGRHNYDNYAARFVARCISLTDKYADVIILPKADLSETMEDKYNRPVDDRYNRQEYQNSILVLLRCLKGESGVIVIPEEYQYEERIKYLIGKI